MSMKKCPKSFAEAMQSDERHEWLNAIFSETLAHAENETFMEVSDVPLEKKLMRSR